jgi:DNA processing protein
MMERAEGSQYSTLTVQELLGRPLNDVERKYAPKSLYAKGPLEIPLLRPKVSIVGSRKASPQGLESAGTIAITLARNEVVH